MERASPRDKPDLRSSPTPCARRGGAENEAEGQGEQAPMFFYDPSAKALELKAFADFSKIFAK